VERVIRVARKSRHWLRVWAEYLALRSVAAVVTGVPLAWHRQAAEWLGAAVYYLDARHRRRALVNIRTAMPELTPRQGRRLAVRSLGHFIEACTEMFFLPTTLTSRQIRRMVRVTDEARTRRMLAEAGPKIFVTGHFGYWEMLGLVLNDAGVPLHGVARRIDNPKLEGWVWRLRNRHGMKIIDKNDLTAMERVIAAGGALGFVSDQNAGVRGTLVPFFGRLASAHRGVALLAVRFELPVFCGYARRVGAGRSYEAGFADVIRPADWREHPNPVYYVAARCQRAIERMVRLAPEQYLWVHRRWRSRPQFEVDGIEMTDTCAARLRTLPWMTDELMAELAKPVVYPD